MKKAVIFPLLTLFMAVSPLTGCAKNPDGSYRIDTAFLSGNRENPTNVATEQKEDSSNQKPYYVSKNLIIQEAYVASTPYFGNSADFREEDDMPVKDGFMHYTIKNLSNIPREYKLVNYWFRPEDKIKLRYGSSSLEENLIKYLAVSEQMFKAGSKQTVTAKIPIPKNLTGKVIYRGLIIQHNYK